VSDLNIELTKKIIKEELNKLNWANLSNVRNDVEIIKVEVKSLK
jgi:hypothetical protein